VCALVAVAVKFHAVVKDFETMASRNSLLKGFNRLLFEFDDLAASETNQMVVMGSLGGGFVPGLSIGKFSLGGEAQAGEKLKGPIDGGITDLRVDFRHLGIDLRKILMSGGVEEDIENFYPLPGGLQPLLGDEGFKSVRLHDSSFLKLNFNFILRDDPFFVNTHNH
jgi:hypothetical protein